MEDLIDNLLEKMASIEEDFDTYFKEHQNLDYLNNWDEDKVFNLVRSLTIMPEPSASFIYKQCHEGEYRYKQKTPPGYKDNKKDGASKYGDLIAWVETYKYAAANCQNVIFVTDDVKEDWWERKDDGRILFREELVKEFTRKTRKGKENSESLLLVPMVGYDLYQAISKEYMIDAPDAMTMILDVTDEYYVDEINMKVFDSIWSDIAYSGESYFDEGGSHICSEGVEEWELDDVEFDDYERIDVDSGMATYIFTYSIKISGVSYEYWGRDDDTKEVITSPGRRHECSGSVSVLVTRSLESVIDWNDDFGYEDSEIKEATISEDEYEDEGSEFDVYCSQCGERIGYEWDSYQRDYKGNPICDDCMTTDEDGFVCPRCGYKYPEEMRGGSGTYCIDCERIYDV